MRRMMQQMGIKSEKIPARRVIIEKEDEKIVIDSPSVMSIEQGGIKSYQVTGGTIEIIPNISEEDIKLVSEQSGASMEEAANALAECKGDVAEAIMKLKTK
ncbi:MAG: nascent polypeptide-associated complex protein [Candidatus Micrarchaeia archaeon]